MKEKPKMTRAQLKERVVEEAKVMKEQLKKEGTDYTIAECKREAEKVFRDEYEIV